MPLIYLPLIMYTSWLEFMTQPFRMHVDEADADMRVAAVVRHRGTQARYR